MKELSHFLTAIMPFAPGCAKPTAYSWIRQAAIEFCERTRLWRFEDEFRVVADDELIAVPDGAVVHEIESAAFDGRPLIPRAIVDLDRQDGRWRDNISAPNFITQPTPDTIRLAPRGNGTLRVSLFLKPSTDTDVVPDWMVDQHRQVIADGALARILVIPNQSFTNVDMAGVFMQRFESKLTSLFDKGLTGQQRAPLRTKPMFF